MTGDEYRDFIINNPNATEAMITAVNLYPGVNTDWQDEVMRTAVSTEHNISAYGSVKDYLPYRVSFGYTNQNGILKTSNFERYTGSVSLTPKFFDDHLNMNLNAKGIYIKISSLTPVPLWVQCLSTPPSPLRMTTINSADTSPGLRIMPPTVQRHPLPVSTLYPYLR